jgi:hypothetical protein
MKPYLLNGKEAQGKEYIGHLESLSNEDDIRIGLPGDCGLIVSLCSEGFFVTEERDDGSTFLTTGLTKERVTALIDDFLSGTEDWREGFEWELTTLPSRRAARRSLVLLLVGGLLVALIWWLAKDFGQ